MQTRIFKNHLCLAENSGAKSEEPNWSVYAGLTGGIQTEGFAGEAPALHKLTP